MFNFKRLIKKYSKFPVYELKESEGYQDINKGGVWIAGGVEIMILPDSAIVPLSNSDLKFDEGGTYSTEDRKLYTYKDIETGTKIKHKEKEYTILERKDYQDFDVDLFIYILKRVDAND